MFLKYFSLSLFFLSCSLSLSIVFLIMPPPSQHCVLMITCSPLSVPLPLPNEAGSNKLIST